MRVLIVEDEPILRDALSSWLTARGFDVVVVKDCSSGIDAAIRSRPDVILLDLKLPDKSGLELLRILKARGVIVPCVILTGAASPIDGFAAGQLGVGQFIQKPASPDQVAHALRHVANSETWDVVATLYQIARHWNLSNRDTQTEILHRLLELLADPSVDLLEFAWLAALVRRAALDQPIVAADLIRTAMSIQRDREKVPASMKGLLIALAKSASHQKKADVKTLTRRARHEIHHVTGRRFSSWHNLAILQIATQELSGTNEYVSQIAHRLGVPRGGQLGRDLRSLIGCSPRELRRQLGR